MPSKRIRTRDFYDRVAEVHHFALQVNGYRRSVARYLRTVELGLGPDSLVLDAGSGTGIITLGFFSAGFDPKHVVGLDLSFNSLRVARKQYRRDKKATAAKISAIQGNVLQLPFGDGTFDLVITCGVLEYVPLDDGLKELARALKPSGKLVFIPVKPSLVGSVLEFLYKFRIHPIEDVTRSSERYFDVVEKHEFRVTESMGWSKTAFLLAKK